MMLVHVEVALRSQLQVERAVARHQLKHVIEEADSAADLGAAAAFDGERNANVGLVRLAVNVSAPHAVTSLPSFSSSATSRRAVIRRFVCSVVPTVMRTHPSQPGSLDRSRTSIPRVRMATTNSR